jgi:hypothetical protein
MLLPPAAAAATAAARWQGLWPSASPLQLQLNCRWNHPTAKPAAAKPAALLLLLLLLVARNTL